MGDHTKHLDLLSDTLKRIFCHPKVTWKETGVKKKRNLNTRARYGGIVISHSELQVHNVYQIRLAYIITYNVVANDAVHVLRFTAGCHSNYLRFWFNAIKSMRKRFSSLRKLGHKRVFVYVDNLPWHNVIACTIILGPTRYSGSRNNYVAICLYDEAFLIKIDSHSHDRGNTE